MSSAREHSSSPPFPSVLCSRHLSRPQQDERQGRGRHPARDRRRCRDQAWVFVAIAHRRQSLPLTRNFFFCARVDFKNAHGINVPRSRFLPVKSCSDLLLITSDLYQLEHGQLTMNSERMFQSTPVVKLGDHFKKVRFCREEDRPLSRQIAAGVIQLGCLEFVIDVQIRAQQVAQFQKRFKTIPSLLEVDHLTVAGDVSFGRNVVLRGTVIM